MRFDVRLFFKISDVGMLYFVVAHIGLFWLTAWGVRISLQARAWATQSILPDVWNTPLLDLLIWACAIVAYNIAFACSFVNGIALPFILGQWFKTKGWPLPGLWMGLLGAVYANIWMFNFVKHALVR
ncbi:hypothetical protein [Ciceribacter sp. L1K22]|uniref:hypothetical protein n=1 Tax=Ciceribacter sp. L1K22 TaxID=2820275 RepID=UPI001ABDBE6E|nr:hypothetical protein [Ciceribacter sp. L1K22]MBO3759479.1 hypothetical protein [Ciceribacter sp. L1K22]